MLILNPRRVTFGALALHEVTSITIDRLARRITESWSDHGSFLTHADVPEQSVHITLTQELTRDELDAPIPGEQADLSVFLSPTRADSGRVNLTATTVVLSVAHEISQKKGAIRTITLAAISTDAIDPITITDASNGQT